MMYIKEIEELEKVLNAEKAVLYKHSPVCGVSAAVKKEVDLFVLDHSDVPVYVIDVRAQRPLSRETADRLEIRHESPQAIVIINARPVWHASHFDINADSLAAAVTGR
ncbi:MAG: bacillithiol system redox-active protein YtxJ [Candidatus Krumholzibacteria bacterium]|nr:bacillithiol system redox-active protein YtxJ [Candidatus Krumholzibacteria bacterium]